MKCRHCNTELDHELINLGSAPPSNAYLSVESLRSPEKWFPLKVLVCNNCWLVQTEDYTGADELFGPEYAYFSSFSATWLRHAEDYVDCMIKRFSLNSDSKVIEVAANDGYLLQYVNARGIPCLGIEPTLSTAEAARKKGIEIVEDFFGVRLANKLLSQGMTADLMVSNNVLAHVPDINDFVSGFPVLLKDDGVATFEFPHLQRLVAENQFDTIYHEHFSYLSLTAVDRIFLKNGLEVFDVEEMTTHGGSLRVFTQRKDVGKRKRTLRVSELLDREHEAGIDTEHYYKGFQSKADKVKNDLVSFLIKAKQDGKKVAAYGAAAKGNTLLNYAGIRFDLLPWVADRNPAKQGKFLPGSRIPVCGENRVRDEKPDFILILPWNLRTEIMEQLSYIRDWGGRFVAAVPELWVENCV